MLCQAHTRELPVLSTTPLPTSRRHLLFPPSHQSPSPPILRSATPETLSHNSYFAMNELVTILGGLTAGKLRLPSDTRLTPAEVSSAFSGLTPPSTAPMDHPLILARALGLVDDIAGLLSPPPESAKVVGMVMEATFNHLLEAVGRSPCLAARRIADRRGRLARRISRRSNASVKRMGMSR